MSGGQIKLKHRPKNYGTNTTSYEEINGPEYCGTNTNSYNSLVFDLTTRQMEAKDTKNTN